MWCPCHSRESGNPDVQQGSTCSVFGICWIPAFAGMTSGYMPVPNGTDLTTFSANFYRWIPAFAGMTYNVTLLGKRYSVTFLVIPAKAGIQKKRCIFLKSVPFVPVPFFTSALQAKQYSRFASFGEINQWAERL